MKDSLSAITHIGLRKYQLTGSPLFSIFFHMAIGTMFTTEVLEWLRHWRSQAMMALGNYYVRDLQGSDDVNGLADTGGRWMKAS
jgi:hypothetical protein